MAGTHGGPGEKEGQGNNTSQEEDSLTGGEPGRKKTCGDDKKERDIY